MAKCGSPCSTFPSPWASGPTSRSSSREALLPLGALLLAASVSGWAQTESGALAPVIIKGQRDRASQTYQGGITSVGKTPAAAMDIPQSLTVVNDKLLQDQGKDSFKEALRNVPGITFEAGEGGRIGDSIRLRGFSVSGDIGCYHNLLRMWADV